MASVETVAKVFSRLANISGIGFALFISVFALDVFSDDQKMWNTIVSLLIHLIPSFVILLLVFFARRKPILGAMAFILLAIAYLFFAKGRFNWTVYAAISGPLAIISILYFASWWYQKQ